MFQVQYRNSKGKLHRVGAPAVVTEDQVVFYNNGKCHRVNEPAVIYKSGNVEFWVEGKLHRGGDKPAIEFNSETQQLYEYWFRGKRSRLGNKPAYVSKRLLQWWENGKLTRSSSSKILCSLWCFRERRASIGRGRFSMKKLLQEEKLKHNDGTSNVINVSSGERSNG